MVYTEAEAKHHWCPFSFVVTERGSGGVNREFAPGQPTAQFIAPATCCIASQCMMWREVVASQADEEPRGYCGLGGADQ
jgi:hypothetical protein